MRLVLLIDPDEAARRVRAAIAYSGQTLAEVEAATGISVATLRRMTSRQDPSGATIERMWAVAAACDVPRAFLEQGWPAAMADAEKRYEAIASQVEQLNARMEELRRWNLRPLGDGAQRPRDDDSAGEDLGQLVDDVGRALGSGGRQGAEGEPESGSRPA